jgi:tRNA (cmo5U34)-methyltransferase
VGRASLPTDRGLCEVPQRDLRGSQAWRKNGAMGETTIKRAFDQAARDYDRTRRKLIPGFDDFYRAAIDSIPFGPDDPIRVLDLGAGTGFLSFFVASHFRRAVVTLVDVSDEMLAVSRNRLEAGGVRFRFYAADYAEAPIEEKYDAIVSALSVHHLDDESKRRLFGKIYDALEVGGVFVNADQVRGETEAIERRNHERWLVRVRELGLDESSLRAVLERMKLDCAATLDDQLAWLRERGFRDVACSYRNLIFAVYSAIK